MDETLRSMLLSPSALYVLAGIALALTLSRRRSDVEKETADRFVEIFLVGVSVQCLHFAEEFTGGLHVRFPQLAGLAPLPDAFFVILNLAWIALWLLAAIGFRRRVHVSLFFIWFFILGALANVVLHPLAALALGSYVPGLITAPFLGVAGAVLWRRLWAMTAPPETAPPLSS